MPLFQQSVQKKFIKDLDKAKVETAYQKLIAHFGNIDVQENIKKAKEEQYQEGFLRELFVDVLGYVLHPQPNYNLITEQKNEKNSKKADGAILTMGQAPLQNIPSVKAVIELKSVKTTDLQSIEIQAFNYKNNQTECVYVITSNFQKLRFYIENAVDFEEFDLFDLSKERFELLYLCLHVDNILSDLPLRIKQASHEREENITKKLYADYSLFKHTLFKDISTHNKGFDQLTLFKKTQKLLDRFLFIFFAEDKGLLPPNSVSEILNQWDKLKELDAYQPLYNRFKLYFGYLNNGHKGKNYDIFAYNGGLFAPDELLDNFIITDNILYNHCRVLSHYDFDTEVDTNILGHIFEHSLNEVDEIAATAATMGHVPTGHPTTGHLPMGHAPLANAPLANKRKKDGIFYTPRYITKYIVESTVGELCKQKKIVLGLDNDALIKADTKKDRKLYQVKIEEYRQWLLQLTILDPACGSGAFLNQALEFLIQEHRLVDTMTAMLFGDSLIMTDNITEILENNIFGVDINEESVEIARLSLWLRTAKIGRKLNDLSRNIKVGNSLISDPSVAGDLAFDWQTAFPNVFKEKDKQAWHITCVMHNTRTSQRMIDYKVKKGVAEWLLPHEEVKLAEIIRDIVLADNLNIINLNICADHLHFVLVAENEAEMTRIVAKIKSMSARQFNIWRGITHTGETGHTDGTVHTVHTVHTVTRGHALLSTTGDTDSTSNTHSGRGETQNSLWAQKFNRNLITSYQQLDNTLQYIENNRIKHNLPINEELFKVVKSFTKDWDTAMRPEYKGGFDVVIGNPPYVRQELLGETMKNAFSKAFPSVYNGVADLYVYFYNKGVEILKENGMLGYITPNNWLEKKYGYELRQYLKLLKIEKLIDYGELRIFEDASTEPAIIVLSNTISENGFAYASIKNLSIAQDSNLYAFKNIDKNNLRDDIWRFANDIGTSVLEKFAINTISLSDYTKGGVYYGIKTGFNKAFIINQEKRDEIIKKDPNAASILRKEVEGDDFGKWHLKHTGKYMIFFPRGEYDVNDFPSIENFLKPFYEDLKPKNNNDTRGRKAGTYRWFETQDIVVYYKKFESPKLIYYHTALNHGFYYDTEGYYISNNCYFISNADRYLQCILNSKVFHFCKKYLFPSFGDVENGGRVRLDANKMATLPIKNIDEVEKTKFQVLAETVTKDTADFQRLNTRFIKLFQSSFSNLTVNKKIDTWYDMKFGEFRKELEKQKIVIPIKELMDYQDLFETNATQIKEIQTKINHTEKAIDKLVYALYDLTDDEIHIIENQ